MAAERGQTWIVSDTVPASGVGETQPTIDGPHPDPHPPNAFSMPTGACDAHCHVFGPASRFPYAAGRSYTPPDAGFEQLTALHRRMGLSRAVIVQASCHGTDNAAMVDALRRGEGRYAGVAMIEEDCSDGEIEQLHLVGVRGARFNFVRHLGGGDIGAFERTARRVASFGWHMVVHFDATDIAELSDVLMRLPCPFIIDHMARVPAAAGLTQPPFAGLLRLLDDERAWVKISGAERLSATGGPGYDDVVPQACALIDAAGDRILWGTDWPHPNVADMPDDGDLVDLLAAYAPDEVDRHRILVDNPQQLYDFK